MSINGLQSELKSNAVIDGDFSLKAVSSGNSMPLGETSKACGAWDSSAYIRLISSLAER